MTLTPPPSAPALVVTDGLFLTMAEGLPDPYIGWMEVGSNGRIAAMGAGPYDSTRIAADLATRVLDANGAFVAPGFVSAHSHLFTSGSRGLGMDQSLYGWIDEMTVHTRIAEAEDLYWFTLHGSLDFLNNGITTAYDFTANRLQFRRESDGVATYVGPLRAPEIAFEQLRAKVDAGIRFVNSIPLDDGIGDADEILGRLADVVAHSASYHDHPGFLGNAISGAVQWAPLEITAAIEAEAMARFDILNQAHFLETPYEIDLQRSKFAWYRDAGALGPKMLFGHFVQAEEAQIVEAAAHGCGMVWQPTSNGRLASGVANVPRCLEVGMRVGVGLDDQACTDVSDPFQNLRMGIYLQRAINKSPKAMGVRQMLELHTRESARVLGVEADVGSLEVGKYADFLIVDPTRPDTGPMWDPYGTYVLACSLRNLKQVWVGGELISDEGIIVSQDSATVSAELHERMARLDAQFRKSA
jgi:5-methylthioadenosine/S-adenosylhomocysteine deaminase